MKKFLAFLLTLFICLTAVAQVENSIVLDSKSFRAVQQDALTGVNIDPIGVDHSRQACARVKIKFDRMNRAQIDALVVKMRSNTDLTKQKVADYYDNVLILEMTAKPNTRFYFVSPEFGESNEVTLNLEANREYEMLASLNQTYSIIVDSNIAGADVYLDGIFKGQTDSAMRLTVREVLIGEHTLKLTYGAVSHEQKIEVNGGSISFRQNVDTAANEPQFVVFAVEPTSAVVIINNQHYTLTEGAMRVVLDSGTYNYTVTAAGYHPQSGTFTVSGAKVEKHIALKADIASVTLTAPDGAEIWINGEKRGVGSWSGNLTSGTYIFEARKAGHRTTTLSKHITSAQPQQSYTLTAPTPIVGSVMVDGTPLMADVAIDGKSVGTTPLKISNILIGNHKVTVSKSGYAPYSQSITVTEGKTATVSVSLTEHKAQDNYKIGDIVTVNGVQGIVFQTAPQVKIVSVVEGVAKWSTQKQSCHATDWSDAPYNMARIMAMPNWATDYPAVRWCTSLGEGWYLPTIRELRVIYENKMQINLVLSRNGMATLGSKNKDEYILSSSEYNDYKVYNLSFKYGFDNRQGKDTEKSVRAVYAFEKNSITKSRTSAPYKVGDYYNDGVKEGVVFEVNSDGYHGKIVSMKNSSNGLAWSYEDILIKAKHETEGLHNLAKVSRRKVWRKNYRAFAWCVDLGDSWYLPAIGELQRLFAAYEAVNKTVVAYGGEWLYKEEKYWSSTECPKKIGYYFDAYAYHKEKGAKYTTGNKFASYTVRAVASF
ncbi:MAG: PEGA domain-containing protein [Alistipes sp.]|nr:PEGA domain-containing protein [Alistipes sp.]